MPHFMLLTTISKAVREGMALAIGANGFRMSRGDRHLLKFYTSGSFKL
jgi:hypothetical protein